MEIIKSHGGLLAVDMKNMFVKDLPARSEKHSVRSSLVHILAHNKS